MYSEFTSHSVFSIHLLLKQNLTMWLANRLIFALTAGLALIWCGYCGLALRAEEPYERFLEKLEDEGLYDLALAYLDRLEKKPGIPDDFRAELNLQRSMLLYKEAARLPLSNPDRQRKLDEAEAALRRFLKQHPKHPRAGEAWIKLGELLMARGEDARRATGDDVDRAVPDAVRFYDEAHKTFEQGVKYLAGILEGLKGARVEAKDQQAVAYRQSIQQQIRQAQLLSAAAVRERGKSRAPGPEREADLKAAATMFGDLFRKETRLAGIRYFALFYRSQIQRELGLNNDAVDGFQRIADLEGDGIDPLRPLQMLAVKELVELLTEEKKFPLAVDRGQQWVRKLRPDEVNTQEAIDLKVALDRARIAWASALKEKDPEDRAASRLVREARSDLRSLMRIQGSHLDQVRELLAQVGVDQPADSDVPQELPDVSTFEEAFAAAEERIDEAESEALAAEVMREKGDDAGVAAAQERIEQLRRQAVELLRRALALFGPQDDRERLFEVRYRLAYLHLRLNEPMSAIAIGEFLATTHGGTDQGLLAATIALGGMSDLLRTAGSEERRLLAMHLESLTNFLVAHWPESNEAASAAAALVQLALVNQQLDKVEEYLKLIPDAGGTSLELRRDVGLALYGEYLKLRRQADSNENAPDVQDMRRRAIKTLEPVVSALKVGQMTERDIQAVSAYVRLLLAEDQFQAAWDVFQGPASPLKILDKNLDAASPNAGMEVYRTAIQLTINALASGKIQPDKGIEETKKYIAQLQKLAQKSDDGNRVLAGIFVGLAKDTNSQLEAAAAEAARQRLSQALLLVAGEAASAESFNTRFWAVDTIVGLAETLMEQGRNSELARESLRRAVDLIQQMFEKEKSQPGWIDPPALVVKLRLLLARSYRLLGEYKAALDQLANVLKENPALLDVQMEAARVYEAWGDSGAPLAYRAAIAGGRPIQPGRNLFWGYGKISQITAGKEAYDAYFYDARFALARCRYKYALSREDQEQKLEELRRAAKDIESTAALYPDLGGPEMKRKFDAMLKVIQKALGEPAKGLAGATVSVSG